MRPEAAGQRFVTVAKESAWVTDLLGPLQQLFPEYKIDAKTRPPPAGGCHPPAVAPYAATTKWARLPITPARGPALLEATIRHRRPLGCDHGLTLTPRPPSPWPRAIGGCPLGCDHRLGRTPRPPSMWAPAFGASVQRRRSVGCDDRLGSPLCPSSPWARAIGGCHPRRRSLGYGQRLGMTHRPPSPWACAKRACHSPQTRLRLRSPTNSPSGPWARGTRSPAQSPVAAYGAPTSDTGTKSGGPRAWGTRSLA